MKRRTFLRAGQFNSLNKYGSSATKITREHSHELCHDVRSNLYGVFCAASGNNKHNNGTMVILGVTDPSHGATASG